MKKLVLLLFVLAACARAPIVNVQEEDKRLGQLSKEDAERRLLETTEELVLLDSKISAAELRRDRLEISKSNGGSQEAAVIGLETELDSMREERGHLLHRQHVLEGRLREIEGSK
jgi:hypothetical protein